MAFPDGSSRSPPGDRHPAADALAERLPRALGYSTMTHDDDATIDPAEPVGPHGRIGPYTILQVLGEGGMGVVYLAEQREPIERRVALKVIKLGMDTKEVIARFEAERQALAVMDHPSIAKVFDASASDSGRPYFVMELVNGRPITEHCDAERLGTRERIQMLVQVCHAVQHAHQKGVVHRDLKPSNILVTLHDGRAVPKIIDFGVAKAMDRRLTDRTLVTVAGQPIGTPAYMSPEQLEGSSLDVDTRTDVYSLGVLLYELLAGTLPFEPDSLTVRRGGRHEDPPTPSTRFSRLGSDRMDVAARHRTNVRALERELKGDLDWITLKAMAADRTRRYETADALALDLERHLRSEPVVARPPSALYRLDRFARRHTGGVVAGVAAALVLLAVAALTTIQSQRLALERDRAELEAQKASSINAFLQDVLGSADPWNRGDRQRTVVDALASAVETIDQSFEEQPLVGAAVRSTIGQTYQSLGRYDDAESLFAAALDTRQRLLGDAHADTVESLFHTGVVDRLQGEYAEAEALVRQTIALRRSGEESAALAASLDELARTLDAQGRYDEARQAGEEALSIRRRVLGPGHRDVADSLFVLAGIETYGTGDYDRAEALHREALAIRRDVLGPRHAAVGESLNALAVVHLNQGDLAGAEALYTECLELYRAILGDEHPEVAMVMENLGGVYFQQERHEEAIALLHSVLDVRRRMLGDDHTAVARTIHNMGAVYQGMKDFASAERAYDESIVRLKATLGADHPDVAAALYNVGRFQVEKGDLPAAERTFREVLAIRVEKLAASHPDTASARLRLGSVLADGQRFAEAEPLLLEAHVTLEAAFGSDHAETREAADALAALSEARSRTP